MFKIIANEHYAFTYILSDVLKVRDKKKLIGLYFLLHFFYACYLKMKYKEELSLGISFP